MPNDTRIITAIHQTEKKHKIIQSDHYLYQEPLNNLLEKSIAYLNSWIEMINLATKRFRYEETHNPQPLITKYFKTGYRNQGIN